MKEILEEIENTKAQFRSKYVPIVYVVRTQRTTKKYNIYLDRRYFSGEKFDTLHYSGKL